MKFLAWTPTKEFNVTVYYNRDISTIVFGQIWLERKAR